MHFPGSRDRSGHALLFFLCLTTATAIAVSRGQLPAAECPDVNWAPVVATDDVLVGGGMCTICVHYNQNMSDTSVYDMGYLSESDALVAVSDMQEIWPRFVDDLGFQNISVMPCLMQVMMNWSGDSCNGNPGIQVYTGCYIHQGALRKALTHEMFHELQYEYWGGFNEPDWILEGTARAIEDNILSDIDDWPLALAAQSSFNKEANGYLACTNIDLTSSSYRAALWWKYFTEQFGTVVTEPEVGIDALIAFVEAAVANDDIAAVNSALAGLGAPVDFNGAFRRFIIANWTKDLEGLPDGSYDYIDEEQAGNPAPYGPLTVIDGGAVTMASSPSLLETIVGLESLCPGLTFESEEEVEVSRYGAIYFGAHPGMNCKAVTVEFERLDNGPAFYHIATRTGTTLESHVEGSGAQWARSFLSDGIDELVAVAGSLGNSSRVEVTYSCGDPDLEIVLPNDQAVAHVGPFDGAGKLLAQVRVLDAGSGAPMVGGFAQENFQAKVGGIDATIVAGGFIQQQYWLLVQAPPQAANGTYNLQIVLQKSGQNAPVASDVQPNSVVYSSDQIDQVLVIDRSGSMSSDAKLEAAQAAASLYVDISRNGDGISVVPYNHDVNPAPFAMQTASGAVRLNAKTYIAGLTASGATSIGDGLSEAVSQRAGSLTGNPLCSFVLLSDGMENSAQFWAGVQAMVVGSGCPVTAIAFGAASDETLMQDIATATGGPFFFNDVFAGEGAGGGFPFESGEFALDLGGVYEYAQARAEGRERIFSARALGSPPAAEEVHDVLVDESITEIVFVLDWSDPGAVLELRLRDPGGREITSATVPYTFEDLRYAHVGWRFRDAQAGRWQMVVMQPAATRVPVPYQVIASGRSSLSLHLLLPDQSGARFATGDAIPIHALLSTHDGPVSGASVVARVFSPDGASVELSLLDDGEHDDGVAGDGLHGGVFTRATLTSVAVPEGEDVPEPPAPKPEAGYRVVVRARGERFQRESLGGFSILRGADTDADGLPDSYVARHRLASADGDPDLDGLSSGREYFHGTDPNDSDTDGGGEGDGSEVEGGRDPLDPSDDLILAPDFFRAYPRDGAVLLTYDVLASYRRLVLYRADASGAWGRVEIVLSLEGAQEIPAENGKTFRYRLEAIDGDEHRSAILQSEGVTPSEDPLPPEGTVAINGSAEFVCGTRVTLTFRPEENVALFEDIVEVAISHLGTFAGARWQPFEPEMEWDLVPVESGSVANVYVLFRDAAGNVSAPASDSIIFFDTSDCPGDEPGFLRGNANVDTGVNVSDAIYVLGYLFLGQPRELACDKAADMDDDGTIVISDAIFLLGYLFLGTPQAIPAPFDGCGRDPTPDDLSCRDFGPCR